METNRRSYFGSVAETYEKARPGYPLFVIDRINEFVGHEGGGVALDVGCGTGKGTACVVGGGWQVTGVDIDERMLEVARSTVPRALFLATEVGRLDSHFEVGSFDLVTAFAAAHWFAEDREIAQLRRVLKPGGALCLVSRERLPEDGFDATIRDVLSGYVPRWPQTRKSELDFDAQEICKRAGCAEIKVFELRQIDTYTPREAAQFAATKSYFAHVPQELRESALLQLERVFEGLAATRKSPTVESVSLLCLMCGRLPG